MAGHRRRRARVLGAREAQAIAANLGRDARATRRRRRLTQWGLGALVDLSQSEISRLERGHGAGVSIETWVAIGMALERPVAIGFSRDVVDAGPADAGHLAAQELLVRLATAAGWVARIEAPSRPDDPRQATDVVLERGGITVLVEVWNRLDDLGAAIRSGDRKRADVAIRGGGAGPVVVCWAMVDTAANRLIVRRYPALLRTRFDGSSAAWARALTAGPPPPTRPGVVWIDPRSATVRPMRLRAAAG